jgi:hypothetical protein
MIRTEYSFRGVFREWYGPNSLKQEGKLEGERKRGRAPCLPPNDASREQNGAFRRQKAEATLGANKPSSCAL